jgi:hypothetical protein
MQAIADVCQVYPISEIALHSPDIWQQLKDAVLHSSDIESEEMALVTIQALFESLSKDDLVYSKKNGPLEILLEKVVIGECMRHILETPESIMANQSSRVLSRVVCASVTCCEFIIGKCVGSLLMKYPDVRIVTGKQTIVETLLYVLQAGRSLYRESDEVALLEYKDRLFELFGRVISSNDTDLYSARGSAILGAYEMLQTKGLLGGQEVLMAVRMLGNVVVQNREVKGVDVDVLRKAAIDALILYGRDNPALVSEIVLADCSEQLPGLRLLLIISRRTT